jgi:hypothetical protein
MSPLVGMICRDRRLKHDREPLESRLRSRRSSRMIRPNDLAVCLSPISFGGRASKSFPAAFDDRGLKGSDEKCAYSL